MMYAEHNQKENTNLKQSQSQKKTTNTQRDYEPTHQTFLLWFPQFLRPLSLHPQLKNTDNKKRIKSGVEAAADYQNLHK